MAFVKETSGGPEVAVVIPLDDPRGDVAEHLRTWTRGQTLPRERFQMILSADGRHPDFERKVATELVPHDDIVAAPGAAVMGLYEAATPAAKAPVLLLSEAHVRADPRCLEVVAEAFAADPELDIATLRHIQNASAGISPLSERWFTRAFAEWGRAGWLRLNTTGVAIRREAYDRAGGIDPRLGLYAPSLMSARLDENGARSTHLEDAILIHELEQGMGFALELGGDFARGECVVRRELDPEFCERYFGPAGLWERRLAYRGEVVRPMVSALGSAIRESPRDAAWLTRELVARLPASVAGSRPRRIWEQAVTRLHRGVAAFTPLPDEARWRSYIAAQEANVRAVQLEEDAAEQGIPRQLDTGAEATGADRLDGLLIGTRGLEEQQGRTFRWTEPVALLRLAAPSAGATLRIDTGGLRGAPLEYLHGVYSGSQPLPRHLISAGNENLEIQLPPELVAAAADPGLVLVCRPLTPSRNGSSDRRRLGMPVAELELSPA